MPDFSVPRVAKGTLRTVKNYSKGYSDMQAKVREATSNDPWGPSGTQMNEIAQATYNHQDFIEIMEMLDKRLNDKGKNWRHVFKALTLLDYCLHAGSENVVLYFKDNIYVVKTLKEFQYVDEHGKDQGANVRQKAKDITNLLQDEARLREERKNRASMKERIGSRDDDDWLRDIGPSSNRPTGQQSRRRDSQEDTAPARLPPRRGTVRREDDDELKRAIEASKLQAEEDEKRRRARMSNDDDFAKAIRLSKEDEEKRQNELAKANQNALFDDSWQLEADRPRPPQQQQQQQYDFFGNPIDQSQNQLIDTSLDNAYNPYAAYAPPINAYNPYQQQQDDYARQQQEMMAMMEQQQQREAYERQQREDYERRQREDYERQQQMLAMQQQQPMQTGTNNPFASFSSTAQQPVMNEADQKHAALVQALASGTGTDTFGNMGDARLGPNFRNANPNNPFNRSQVASPGAEASPAPYSSSTSAFNPQSGSSYYGNSTGANQHGADPASGYSNTLIDFGDSNAPQQAPNGSYNNNPFGSLQQNAPQQTQSNNPWGSTTNW